MQAGRRRYRSLRRRKGGRLSIPSTEGSRTEHCFEDGSRAPRIGRVTTFLIGCFILFVKVIRYYPYFDQAFALMKELIIEMMDDTGPAEVVRRMLDVGELYETWGKGDFWVVSPCHSTAREGRLMEGTRLTVQRKDNPTGYEVSHDRLDALVSDC